MEGTFVCPGCHARFRVTKAPKSGRIKCPKCGLVSATAAGPPPVSAPRPAPPPPPVPTRAAPPPAPPGLELAPGATVSGHEILGYLGGSEYTAAYRASQKSMSRVVLFRMLRRRHASNPEIRAKFFAGARAAAKFNHQNLLSVFDMGEEGDVCFYTTEFVVGGTLPEFLGREEKISSEQRLSIATQIVRALTCAETSGISHIWMGPEHVLLTEKGDVRLSRVGTGAPLEGGTPEPVFDVMVRLVYLALTGRDLPAEARPPDHKGPIKLPLARDPLASQLNGLLQKLLAERGTTYKTTGDFLPELEKLTETTQRRGTVDAAATPGGVVPIHLKRAQSRDLPIKSIIIGTAIVALLVAFVSFEVLTSMRKTRREKEAKALWEQTYQKYGEPPGKWEESWEKLVKGRRLLEQARTKSRGADAALWQEAYRAVEGCRIGEAVWGFQKLATDFPDTPYGEKAAKEGLPNIRVRLIGWAYAEVDAKFKENPRDTTGAIAAIRSTQQQLDQVLPGDPLVKDQEATRVKNVGTRYENAATREWNETVSKEVERFCWQMQFGEALAKLQGYTEKWSDSAKAKSISEKVAGQVKDQAKKAFDDAAKRVETLRSDGKDAEAEDLLDKIIRNFKIPEYVKKAEEMKKPATPKPPEPPPAETP